MGFVLTLQIYYPDTEDPVYTVDILNYKTLWPLSDLPTEEENFIRWKSNGLALSCRKLYQGVRI